MEVEWVQSKEEKIVIKGPSRESWRYRVGDEISKVKKDGEEGRDGHCT